MSNSAGDAPAERTRTMETCKKCKKNVVAVSMFGKKEEKCSKCLLVEGAEERERRAKEEKERRAAYVRMRDEQLQEGWLVDEEFEALARREGFEIIESSDQNEAGSLRKHRCYSQMRGVEIYVLERIAICAPDGYSAHPYYYESDFTPHEAQSYLAGLYVYED